MSDPNAATRDEHCRPTSSGETDQQSRPESDPDSGTTGTGVSEQPKGTGALDAKLERLK